MLRLNKLKFLSEFAAGVCVCFGLGLSTHALAADVPGGDGSGQMAPISVSVDGKFQALPEASLIANGVWVDFASSPKLAELYRSMIAAKGYKLSDSLEQATVRVLFTAGMAFKRPKEAAQKVSVGKLFESVKMEDQLDAAKEAANDVRGESLRTFNIQNAMMKSGAWWAGTTLVTALVDMTGVRSTVNRALTGDGRGICLLGCDDWKKYAQDLVVKVTIESPIVSTVGYVNAKTLDETLRPQELFDRAMVEVATRIFPPVGASEVDK